MEHVLRTSMESGKPAAIIYMSGGIITKRYIKVLKMDDKIIRAYCYLRRGPRVFRLENILAAEGCTHTIYKV